MHALYRNHMGSDLEVVNDARISFDKTSKPAGFYEVDIPHPCEHAAQTSTLIPNISKGDQGLIGFLARGCRSGEWEEALDFITGEDDLGTVSREQAHQLLTWAKRMPTHWTPFGQQQVKLRMKAPVPIRTQAFKSKMGFVENEESRRYIDSTPEVFIPEYRERPEGSIKQGSGGLHPDNEHWKEVYRAHTEQAVALYEKQIKAKIAPEQARFVLPQGCYVNWVWTGSLYAYAEFYNKRSDRDHSQGEIADLADAIAPIMHALFPVSWKALTSN